jgi:hypothetical protein
MTKTKIGKMNNIIHYNASLNPLRSDLEKKYKAFDYDTGLSCIDRYGVISHYLPVISYSKPLESNPSFNETFDNLCDKRAIELLNRNKIINVFWSGGLDSTTALISLIMNCINKDQICIITNYNAIIESGYFYETFLKSYNTIFDLSGIRKTFNQDELYVTGTNGNQLFSTGSMNISSLVKDIEDLKKPYKKVAPSFKLEMFEPIINKSPKPIISYEDFLWFEGFAFRWEHPRWPLLIKYLKPKNIKNYINVFFGFFYDKDFEQWCINNNEQQHDIKNFLYTTKLPMRKYIFKKLGQRSEDYIKNKKITRSTWIPNSKNFKYITTDLELHYIYDE